MLVLRNVAAVKVWGRRCVLVVGLDMRIPFLERDSFEVSCRKR